MRRNRSAGLRLRGAYVLAFAYLSEVTLEADGIAGKPQLRAVWVVAIATGYASREHFALLEGAVVIDLVEHLPVGGIEPSAEERYGMRIGEPLAREPIL